MSLDLSCLTGQTCLVTGAGGFIGRHLTRVLCEVGARVLAADLAPVAGLPDGATSVTCDIRDRASVEAALRGRDVAFGVHLAARVGDWGDRADYEATNVGGTRNVLEALIAGGARRIVHVSSIVVLGYEPGFGALESTEPVDAGDLYTDTKSAAERVAREKQAAGAPVVIVRPGDVYGPGSEPWVLRPVRMMKAGQMLFVDGGRGSFAHVYVDNLVQGLLRALTVEAAVGRTYTLTDGVDDTTFRWYFTRLAEVAGVPPPRLSVPRWVAWPLAASLETAARLFGFTPPITRPALSFVGKRGSYSIERARRELGYTPTVGLEEGLARVGASLSAKLP